MMRCPAALDRFNCPPRGSSAGRRGVRRLRVVLGVFGVLMTVVFGRLLAFALWERDAFLAEARRPREYQRLIPAPRGRLLAHDGTVLACDESVLVVELHYRWLEEPPNPRWLRATARSRLSPAQRRRPQQVAEAANEILVERADLHRRLAELCGLSPDEWNVRCRRIESRVRSMARRVNQRHQQQWLAPPPSDEGAPWWRRWWQQLQSTLARAQSVRPPTIILQEELDYHPVSGPVPLEVLAEVEGHPARYPGVRVARQSRRRYPQGALAAHALGYLGKISSDESPPEDSAAAIGDRIGRMGCERTFDRVLRGTAGLELERIDRRGRVLDRQVVREPVPGTDVMLTIDPALQRTVEALLDAAMQRPAGDEGQRPGGAAAVVMDARTGALRALAAAPRFDPNVFTRGDSEAIEAVLESAGRPLFDRAVQMQIPPGSVFKTVTAAALLETHAVDPDAPWDCRGYVQQPDRQRCLIYLRRGVGHGPTTLEDALVQSCNTYFFHAVRSLEPVRLVGWAARFGLGQPTNVDLPGEAHGHLPALSGDRSGDAAIVQNLAVGQGELTVTPLQVARWMALLANGGRLVRPHVARPVLNGGDGQAEPNGPDGIARVPDLGSETLLRLRRALRRAVEDSRGTGHRTVAVAEVPIAGKTGTAQVGGGQADHAWFAGYVPADRPRYVLVVVVQNGGDGATAAGPVARRMVQRMHELGYFDLGGRVALRTAGRAR